MKKLLCLFLLLLTINSNAQKQGQVLLDSLIAAISIPKNDTLQIRLLNKIVLEGMKINPGAYLKKYPEMGLQLATKMKWDRAIAVFHNSFGDLYSSDEKRDEAIHEYEIALRIQEKIKDSFNICISQNNIGVVHQHNGNYTKAIEYFTRTVKLAEAFHNSYLMSLGYSNIATVYVDQGNYSKALEYLKQSLQLREKDEDAENIAITFQNMGDVYLKQKDSAKAALYFNKALHTFEQTENKEGLALVYGNLASLYSKDSVQKKTALLLKAQSIWESTYPKHPNALSNMGNLGELFLWLAKTKPNTSISAGENTITGKNNFLQQASYYIQKGIALSKEGSGVNNYAFLHSVLSAIEEEKGDYKNSLLHFKTFYKLTDSIYSQENKNKIATIESQKAIDLKDKEIQLNKLALSNRKRTQAGLIAGICLLAIIGGLLFFQSRTRKKTNNTLMILNNQLDDANKVKAKFFAILSHDLRSPIANLVNFLHLQKQEPGIFDAAQTAAHQQKISSSAENLLETMEAMLLWSKGQMENFKPEIKQVAVNDLFSYIEKFFASTENVKFSFTNTTNAVVTTDENYLQTIMHNLTANAVKALKNTPGAAVEWVAKKEGAKTILSITDNGPGLQDEQLKALYDDAVVANTKTGLGLHLIRDLAKAIQCKISVQTNQGFGTTFLLAV